MYRFNIILLVVLFVSLSISAQNSLIDTIIPIEEITVKANKNDNYTTGTTYNKISDLHKELRGNVSLSDLLLSQSTLNIKSYGIGGITSVSTRGGGFSHTAIIWNEINLQSPMNGGVNPGLLSADLIDDISVQYGGSGTLYGSGAMSGLIHLNNKNTISKKNTFKISCTAGSFGKNSVNSKIKYGNKKIASELKIYRTTANNDFEYKNEAKFGSPIEKQTNAAHEQYGVMQENSYRINDYSIINTSVWLQHNYKELQTRITDNQYQKANQTDKHAYFIIDWKHQNNKNLWLLKSAYLINLSTYFDPLLKNSINKNNTYSYINEIQHRIKLHPFIECNNGLNYTNNVANSRGFQIKAARDRFSYFSSIKYYKPNNKLKATLSFRQEIVNGRLLRPVFSIGSHYSINKRINVKANISKNYKIPTFNDLYWNEGSYAKGNPHLKPESGWTSELSTEQIIAIENFQIRLSQTFFYTYINQWIVWEPNTNNIWQPVNKDVGKSNGIELNIKSSYRFVNFRTYFSLHYTYLNAVTINELSEETVRLYNANHQISNNFTLSYKKLSVNLTYNFVSKRLYDPERYLDPYHLFDLFISQKIKIRASNMIFRLGIRNITSTDYQLTAWYAMPGRNYEIGILLEL